MAKKDRGLVQGDLERISSKAFDYYQDEITELVGRHHGVYALYKKDRLYYVGLANNLRGRVKQHLRDRDAKKWDSFSLYLIRNVNYLRELESLLVRIAEPKGNIARGRFARSENLLRGLDAMMAESDRKRRQEMTAGNKRRKTSHKRGARTRQIDGTRGTPILQGKFPAGTKLRKIFKGKPFTAKIDGQGRIRLQGIAFNSPSAAAIHIVGHSTDGWHFWKFRDKRGNWVKLDALRSH